MKYILNETTLKCIKHFVFNACELLSNTQGDSGRQDGRIVRFQRFNMLAGYPEYVHVDLFFVSIGLRFNLKNQSQFIFN